MIQYTKGPWRAEGVGAMNTGGSTKLHPHFDGAIIAEDGTEIVNRSCFLGVMGKDIHEAEGNAKLMAAAPVMYEYLMRMADDGFVRATEIMEQIG